MPYNVPGSAQDAAQRALLVLVEVRGGSVIVLESGDEVLQAVTCHDASQERNSLQRTAVSTIEV